MLMLAVAFPLEVAEIHSAAKYQICGFRPSSTVHAHVEGDPIVMHGIALGVLELLEMNKPRGQPHEAGCRIFDGPGYA